MLEDPKVNFAISTRNNVIGLHHFGIQVDSEAELNAVKKRFKKASISLYDDGKTTCCYAKLG